MHGGNSWCLIFLLYFCILLFLIVLSVVWKQVKKQQSLSNSPKTRTAGFTIATGQGSPSEATGVNRWFKPEVETPSSIRSIQIEEKAMKDLKRFYSSVKIVKKHSFQWFFSTLCLTIFFFFIPFQLRLLVQSNDCKWVCRDSCSVHSDLSFQNKKCRF